MSFPPFTVGSEPDDHRSASKRSWLCNKLNGSNGFPIQDHNVWVLLALRAGVTEQSAKNSSIPPFSIFFPNPAFFTTDLILAFPPQPMG